MNQVRRILALLFVSSLFAMAQATAPSSQPAPNASAPPAGTKTQSHETDTLVQPKPKEVRVTRQMIVAAQKELNDRGYDAGPADGVLGPSTRAALAKFQADQKLPQTGDLDVATMSKLNIGAVETLATAPADVGRGGKAFGHNVKQGHPVAAGKGLAKGAVTSGKKVAQGSESLAKEGIEKVGSGLSKIGRKVEGKAEGEPKNPPPSGQNPPPVSQAPPPK